MSDTYENNVIVNGPIFQPLQKYAGKGSVPFPWVTPDGVRIEQKLKLCFPMDMVAQWMAAGCGGGKHRTEYFDQHTDSRSEAIGEKRAFICSPNCNEKCRHTTFIDSEMEAFYSNLAETDPYYKALARVFQFPKGKIKKEALESFIIDVLKKDLDELKSMLRKKTLSIKDYKDTIDQWKAQHYILAHQVKCSGPTATSMAKVNEILKVMGIIDGENHARARRETLESEEFSYGRRDHTAFEHGSDVERRWILLYNLVLANRIAYCLHRKNSERLITKIKCLNLCSMHGKGCLILTLVNLIKTQIPNDKLNLFARTINNMLSGKEIDISLEKTCYVLKVSKETDIKGQVKTSERILSSLPELIDSIATFLDWEETDVRIAEFKSLTSKLQSVVSYMNITETFTEPMIIEFQESCDAYVDEFISRGYTPTNYTNALLGTFAYFTRIWGNMTIDNNTGVEAKVLSLRCFIISAMKRPGLKYTAAQSVQAKAAIDLTFYSDSINPSTETSLESSLEKLGREKYNEKLRARYHEQKLADDELDENRDAALLANDDEADEEEVDNRQIQEMLDEERDENDNQDDDNGDDLFQNEEDLREDNFFITDGENEDYIIM